MELKYLHYATKFIITDENQKTRIKQQLMRNWDCLMFVQRLDLVSQTCAGGLIFTDILNENKMAAMIINPTKMFNFLMNYQSNCSFLIDFMGFVYSKFNPQIIHQIERKLEFRSD